MKRRLPRDVKYAEPGMHGRPASEIAKRWISKAKRQTHKRERREGKQDVEQRKEEE